MEIKKYSCIIIGAGSGGLNVAGFFSRLGLQVLLVDKSDDHIGGDCLNTGCVPSKALIHVANEIHSARNAKKFLESEGSLDVAIQTVMDYVKSKQEIIRRSENPEYLKNKGIQYISGTAVFINKNTISVNGALYSAKNIVLATGSKPKALPIENDNSVQMYTNETIFSIRTLPKRFVFIGGGPISCELGQAFSRLGSQVTILNTGTRIVEKEIEEASTLLTEAFVAEGISVITSVVTQRIQDKKVYYTVAASDKVLSTDADAVFIGIGRSLNIEGMDIEKAGIHTDESKTRLVVDEYLRTTNKHVYVIGDVAGNYQFTHAAEMHAKVVINNMLSPFKKKFDSRHIAWVTYTTPQIATFGISKNQATEEGCQILTKQFEHDDRAIVDERTNGFSTVYVNKQGEIKGGSMVSENAGEISQELILAMSATISLSSLFTKVYPYPTASRVNKQLAGEWEEKRLTKGAISMLRFLYRVF